MTIHPSSQKLPYINNLLAVFVTGLIAAISVLVHNRGNVSFSAALTDSFTLAY